MSTTMLRTSMDEPDAIFVIVEINTCAGCLSRCERRKRGGRGRPKKTRPSLLPELTPVAGSLSLQMYVRHRRSRSPSLQMGSLSLQPSPKPPPPLDVHVRWDLSIPATRRRLTSRFPARRPRNSLAPSPSHSSRGGPPCRNENFRSPHRKFPPPRLFNFPPPRRGGAEVRQFLVPSPPGFLPTRFPISSSMGLPLARAALDFSRRRRRQWLLAAAAAATGYGAYKLYHLPAIVEKRRRLAKLLEAMSSLVESLSASAETVGLVYHDLNRFLRSDSDELPHTLRQLSKIAASDEFAASVSKVTGALTTGVVRGVAAASESGSGSKPESETGPSISERLLDKLFSTAGSGFASVVVGSFARNLVTAFYSAPDEASTAAESETPLVPEWVRLVCGDEFRRLIGDCVQLFVGTAVAVYLEKTMDLNTFDDMFSGLTNPKHETKMKDILVTVCNGAVETLVKTSHQVLTNTGPSSTPSTDRDEDIEAEEELPLKHIRKGSFDAVVKENSTGWVDMVSSTLAVPRNRRFVMDLTGRVTSETVRSFLDFMLWNLFNSAKRGVRVVRGEVVERGLEVVRYITAKSMLSIIVCLALCLHLMSETRVLVPANSFSPKQCFLS